MTSRPSTTHMNTNRVLCVAREILLFETCHVMPTLRQSAYDTAMASSSVF